MTKVIRLILPILLLTIAILAARFKHSGSDQEEPAVNPADTTAVCDACKDVPKGTFCDDFCGTSLNTENWWYARHQWGGGKTYKNNGVVPENVFVKNGRLYCGANGDNYSGPIKGIRRVGGTFIQDKPGTRVGGVAVSDKTFGSGRYEVRMKLPEKLGVCSAIWTFHYEEYYDNDPKFDQLLRQGYVKQGSPNDGYYVTVNHEIDIEIPSAPKGGDDIKDCSYEYAKLNTWIGEHNYLDNFHHMGFNQSDGKFHVYRFDWHTGGNGEEPRVDFYVDDRYLYTSKEFIPFIKGRLWIGTWFPEWAGGAADFERLFLEVDWVKVTPFNEPNDKTVRETYKNAGLSKCDNIKENEKYLPKCRIATP